MNRIDQIDASGPYTNEADYLADVASCPHYDGGLKAAIARKFARSRITLTPAKAPTLKSWISNPGRFPLNADGTDPNQSTPVKETSE